MKKKKKKIRPNDFVRVMGVHGHLFRPMRRRVDNGAREAVTARRSYECSGRAANTSSVRVNVRRAPRVREKGYRRETRARAWSVGYAYRHNDGHGGVAARVRATRRMYKKKKKPTRRRPADERGVSSQYTRAREFAARSQP